MVDTNQSIKKSNNKRNTEKFRNETRNRCRSLKASS